MKLSSKDVPAEESQGAILSRDKGVWKDLLDTIEVNEHGIQHILELWPAYVRRVHLGRFLAHYELFKNVIDLPGSIVEIGVYRGPSLFTWANLLEIFCPGDRKRFVYGFDSFEGLTDYSEQDGNLNDQSGKTEGGWSAKAVRSEVEALVKIHNQDCFIPERGRCHLEIGRIQDTLPEFLDKHPGLRISLLHLDVDLYEPTKFALEKLFPLVVKGGVVAFDEYGMEPWEGESKAVDEYFAELGSEPRIRKFHFTQQPHGYFIK